MMKLNQTHHLRRLCDLRVALLVLAATLPLLTVIPVAAVEPDRDLFVDTEFGFELLVPTGWRYDRTRVPGSDDSVGICTGIHPDGKQYLQIFAYQGFRVSDFDAWVDGYIRQFATTHAIVDRAKKSGTVQARPAVTLTFSYTDGGVQKNEEHLLVLRDPMSILAIISSDGGEANRDSRAAMANLTASLLFNTVPVSFREMDEAFRRGRNLLAVMNKHADQMRVPEDDAAFVISLSGKETGYVARRLTREERNMKDLVKQDRSELGIRYFEHSWTFEEDGTARHEALDMFATLDGHSALGEFRVVQIPPADSPLPPLIRLDEVIRERDTLFSSRTRNLEKDLPTPQPPIRVDANYLPYSWTILLPGLLLEIEDEPHAFTVYDSETRALRPLIITARGEVGGEESEDARFAFDVQNAFDGPVTKLITDEMGRMQQATTNGMRIERSTAERVDAIFAEKRKAVEKRVYERQVAQREQAANQQSGSQVQPASEPAGPRQK
ncbi:MAG: hypothetical protein AB7N71_07735 [Phycisphaerae bacterium]